MGTPEFAKTILQSLNEQSFPILAVFAQPDKPAGRGKKLQSSPVALYAKEQNLPLYQPHKIRDPEALRVLEDLKADFIVVAAYGKILPDRVLKAAKVDCINVHASLLPKYRGAAPINYCLLEGESETGVAIMRVVQELDAGAVYLAKSLPITDQDDAISLTQKLAVLGAEALVESLEAIVNQGLKAQEQDHQASTYAPKLNKELSDVDWAKSSQDIFNQVRGLVPWPVAQTHLEGKRLRLFKSQVLTGSSDAAPGTITHMGSSGWTVSTGSSDLLIQEVQLEGKKRMNAFDLSNGLRLEPGRRLGDS